MLSGESFEAEQREWLAQQFELIPSTVLALKPSEWAEQKRYLPPQVGPMPGPYRFDVAPYLVEVVDCFSLDSPVRQVSVMKGVQLCLTTGVLENLIGYLIDHVRTAPAMWITADAELAANRLGSHVIPMLQHSGLAHLIQSADAGNARKSGKTEKKVEWEGGGYLLPLGANNEAKLRSVPVEWMLRDEVDGWPLTVGKDGDPIKLTADRTAAYESSSKTLDISTPTLVGQSRITELHAQGDQRKYFVCCLNPECRAPQELRWREVDQAGVVSGIVWDMADGRLVPGSVRYLCQSCGHPHVNDDKTHLLDPKNGAEWRPTATPARPQHRSYHLSALYSPVGMQTWETLVEKWLEAWDPVNNRARDNSKLQVFYNNVLGKAFELRGERVRLDSVSLHRRAAFRFGEIPNEFARKHCGSKILLLTAAIDVHGDQLPFAVFGWCRDRRAFLIEYERLRGDTNQLDDAGTWGEARKRIEGDGYVADDKSRYRIQLTLVDSGYRSDHVYRFAAEYAAGVNPVKGREWQAKNVTEKEFSSFVTPTGVTAFLVTVDRYKDRLSASLRREWDGMDLQPVGLFNAPVDVTEKQLRELTVETKVPKPGAGGGYEWRRPSGAANELWDLYVYNAAALDLIAWDVCRNQLKLPTVDWAAFWEYCEQHRPYFQAA
jgi:phage terminase large subunit GpA-like protein